MTTTRGSETIVVEFDCQDDVEIDPSDEELEASFAKDSENDQNEEYNEDDEPVGQTGTNFTVKIIKDGATTLFNCVAADNFTIENVQFIPKGKDADDHSLYGGPQFGQLEESVVEAFYDYLEDRHINADMAFFVRSYSFNKEQREYVNWLQQMLEFTAKK